MDDNILKSIKFIKSKEYEHLGFVSFIYAGLLFKNIAVWEKGNKSGYKITYPRNKQDKDLIVPKIASIQNKIESEITKHIKEVENDK